MDKDITNRNVWSTKQMILIVAFAISITFSAAMIYAEFVLHGSKLKALEERLEKKDKRAGEDRENIWQVLNKKQDKSK